MNIAKMSPEEIRVAGMKALAGELGPAGLIRFLQQFEMGRGDYSADRRDWLPTSNAAEISQRIRAAPRPDPG
jgi:hypothetical protein